MREYRTSFAAAGRQSGAAPAEAPSPTPTPGKADDVAFTSVEEIIDSIPDEIHQQLRKSSSQAEGIRAGNEYLLRSVTNKMVQFTVPPIKIDRAPNDPQKVRFNLSPDDVKRNSGGIVGGNYWAYFPADTADDPESKKINDELSIKGLLGKCELKILGPDLRLNYDLQETEIVK